MARKKGGLNPEVQDDGGLFGDQMLVYEDDLKKAEETPARKKSAGGRVAKASAEAPVQTPLLPEVEESVEVQADEPVQETAPEESSAREIEEDVTEEARIEEDAAEVSEDEGASPLGARVDEVMTGGVESDGQLTLARYASRAYLEYAMSVVKSRALPDVSDGQKPVQRRILIDMERMGVKAGTKAVKSARVVGDVLGKYHPHGDQSVYDALVRMAQSFSLRYPLIDGEGNFGSRDGDSQAAMRYTEARMSKLADEMLRDIEKDTVDWDPNFDETRKEPKVLPSRFPNLLVNGSSGIAVGMATNIPPHNLREVIGACICVLDNPEAQLSDLMQYVKGPDFPTRGIIMGRSGIRQAYATGRGRVVIRARHEFEEFGKDRTRIVITEIPYQVNKRMLIKSMADQVEDKRLDGISDIRDESDRDGMRIVIELKRDANPQVVLNRLFAQTQLQTSFAINMLALVNNQSQPKILSLRHIIDEYLAFQEEVIIRRTKYDLRKAQERAHLLEGLLVAQDNIDEVIKIIRSSYDNAKENLMSRFGLDDIQAQAILDMRLKALQGLDREKLEAEYKELEEKIRAGGDDYSAIMAKLLADRLTEAFAEAVHAFMRREMWGYETGTPPTPEQAVRGQYRGRRMDFG